MKTIKSVNTQHLESISQEVASILIDLHCFQIRPDPQDYFHYASGLKGPIYCDNRLLISHVDEREKIIQCLVTLIQSKFPEYPAASPFKHVVGIATSGIPYAAWCAKELSKSLLYVRTQTKDHGQKKLVEGSFQQGDSCIVIEDLVNQGKSSAQCLETLKQSHLHPLFLFCLVDYQMKTAQNEMKARECPLFALTTFTDLLKVAEQKGQVTAQEKNHVLDWHMKMNQK